MLPNWSWPRKSPVKQKRSGDPAMEVILQPAQVLLANKDCSRKAFPSGLGTLRTSGLQSVPGGDYLFCHCPRRGSGAWVNNVLTKLLICRDGIMQPKQLLERCARSRATDLGLGLVTNPIIQSQVISLCFEIRELLRPGAGSGR